MEEIQNLFEDLIKKEIESMGLETMKTPTIINRSVNKIIQNITPIIFDS